MPVDDDDLPPWLGERLRDDFYHLFRRETGPDADTEETPP